MRIYSLLAAAALLMHGGLAQADDSAAAESTFQRGKAHMDAGRYAEACADFALSEKLDSSVGTLLNLGECNSKLGKTASAWASFNKAAVKANLQAQARRRDYAKKRANQLKPQLTQLSITAAGEQPSGFKLTRNGEDATLIIGVPVPVDPGEYKFEASAPDYVSWTKTMKVAGKGKTITVKIPALVNAAAQGSGEQGGAEANGETMPGSSPTVSSPGEPDTAPRSSRRLVALGVGGAGIVATATGLVFGSIASGKLSDSEEHCDANNVCTQEGYDLVQDAMSSAHISTALVGVGAAALIAGGILWLTAPSSTAGGSDATALRATPVAGPGEFGLVIAGGF